MSVKKYAPYRADNKAGWDHNRNERLRELKGKVKERLGGQNVEESSRDGQVKKKRKGKKERMKEKGALETEETSETPKAESEDKGLKRKRDAEDTAGDVADAGEAPEGGKKKRRRKKKDAAIEA